MLYPRVQFLNLHTDNRRSIRVIKHKLHTYKRSTTRAD